MKNTLKTLTALAIAIASLNAHAIYYPNYERPIVQAEMQVTETQFGFEDISDLVVTLNKRDGAQNVTSIDVRYTLPNQDEPASLQYVNRRFVVTHENISKDDCGSTVYSVNTGDPMGARSHLSVTDHRTRMCDDKRANEVDMFLADGFGFCGTMDARLSANGELHAVFSIMNVRE